MTLDQGSRGLDICSMIDGESITYGGMSQYKPFIIRGIRSRKEMAKLKKDFGHETKKAAEYIGDEVKENTEGAEHETGIHNVKKDAKSVYNKIKETL